MALRVPAMVKFFTPAYATTSTVNKSDSFVGENLCCLTINRGQLVPIGLARSYVERKEPEVDEGTKPILELDDCADDPSGMTNPRTENTERKSMEKQEELKKRPDPKPEATDS